MKNTELYTSHMFMCERHANYALLTSMSTAHLHIQSFLSIFFQTTLNRPAHTLSIVRRNSFYIKGTYLLR